MQKTRNSDHWNANDDRGPKPRRYRIAMCSDFFYPRLGGVEMHIWSLAQCFLQRGHKVIVLTHAIQDKNVKYTDGKRPKLRSGIRWMTNGLKVYYLPLTSFVENVTYPAIIDFFALFRTICIRERIEIVHGHQATSALMHECLLYAKTMGYMKTVYTDHSLFGFADAASVHLNKALKFTLSTVDHAICVSHTCKANLVLRACLSPEIVSTIPNAVDASKFMPPSNPPDASPGAIITIVVISRLVYRKGMSILVQAIPIVCARTHNVRFLIGGDGPKLIDLEQMRERYQLHDRVELLGAVPHSQVRQILCRGHIFLNSSLTESFCIAILEAASCGLYVVSTCVGGIPEVLPNDMIEFSTEITGEALADAVLRAVPRASTIDRQVFHERVAKMYNWQDVAARTEKVYTRLCTLPDPPLIRRLQLYYGIGPIAGALACIIAAILHLYLAVLEIWYPRDTIEIALDYPCPNIVPESDEIHAE